MNSVLLCGFPKTGNTWIRFIVMNYFNILNNGATETLTYEQLSKIQRHRIERDVTRYKKDGYEPWKFDEGFPPVYHTHVSYNTKFGYYFDRFDKIVYIMRNPYDTMISYYHYQTNRDNPFNGRHTPEKTQHLMKMDNFIKYFLPNYLTHIWETKYKADLVLDYDELRKDTSSLIELIKLFGVRVNLNVLEKAIRLSSFDNIRRMGIDSKQTYGLSKAYRGHFARDGRSGQYKDVLSPEMIDYINKEYEKMHLERKFLDNYYLGPKRLYPLKKVPAWLDLEINTNCNLFCRKCFRMFYVPKTLHMNLDLAKKVIKEFGNKGGKSIRFIERGEPTLSPILAHVVRFANNFEIRTVINTNCVELHPELSKRLIENGISQISCAIDSSDKDTYERLQGKHFEQVIHNLKQVYELSRGTNTTIQVHVNIQKENTLEIHTGIYNAFFEQFSDKVIHQPTYDLRNFTPDIKLSSDPCIEPWRRLIVLADGRTMLCPACFNYNTQEVYLVGDVNTQSLESIWTGSVLRNIRRWHLEGNLDHMWPCASCRLRRYVSEKSKKIIWKGEEVGKRG